VAEQAERLSRLAGLGYTAAVGRPSPIGQQLPDPKDVVGSLAAINRARESLAEGRADAAQGELRRVLEDAPENLSALILLGSAFIADGKPAEAAAPLERAAALAPTNADVRYNLGLALLGSGDAGGAEEAWRAALALAPRYHDAAVNLVDLLQRSGRSGEASGVLARARGSGLDSPVLDFLGARLAYERGDLPAAREAIRRALAGPLPPPVAAEARALAAALGG
jgi:Flp pilus assembly protein TadD